MTGLQIQLFGGFVTWANGEPVNPFAIQKARALLAYLALQPNHLQARSVLADLFWPDTNPQNAAHNLRQTLTFLRQGLAAYQADAALWVDRQTVRFAPTGRCSVDVWQLADELHKATPAALTQAVNRYQGALLTGFYLKNAPEFETWLAAERERWHTAILRSLTQLSSHHQARGEYEAARRFLQQAVALDPWHEQAHRDLMRLLVLINDSTGALAQYERCREALESGLGVPPLLETQALAEDIRAGRQSIPAVSHEEWLLQFVGRGNEHAQLVQAFHLRRTTPFLLLVAGALGIGKTRLLQEFARYVGSHGALGLTGRCLAFEVPVPFQAISMVLRLGLPFLRSALPAPERAELARLLPELGHAAEGTDEAARQRLFLAVTNYLALLGKPEQPLVLFLDDLHWVDAASLDLLRFLLYQAPSRLLIVAAYRPEDILADHPLQQMQRSVSRDRLVAQLSLPPLTESSVYELSHSLVQEEQVAELTQYLWQESRGNGFVLVELLHELKEKYGLGAMPWKLPSQWTSHLVALTQTVRDVVLDRVERLPLGSQTALQKAAIIGAIFDHSLLSAVFPHSSLGTYVREWQARGLVQTSGQALEFSHDKIRAVLLEALPAVQKASWHTEVAQALSQQQPEATSRLAHHYFSGSNPAQALPYLVIAAGQAAQVLAFGEVIALCSQALGLASVPPHDQLKLLQLRQRAFQFLGNTEAEGQDALALLSLAQQVGDDQQLAAAVHRLSRFYYLRGRAAEARQAVANILQVAREDGNVETTVRVLNMMAMLLRNTLEGQVEALHCQAEALALVRAADEVQMEGLLLCDTAVILSEKGDWGAALAHLQAGLALLRQVKAVHYLPHALYIQGGLWRAVGQYALAHAALAEASSLCQTHQLGTYLVQIHLEEAKLALVQHQLPAAGNIFDLVKGLAETDARPVVLAQAFLGLGRVAYHEGDFARAADLIRQAADLCPEEQANLTVSLQAALALAMLGLQRENEAEALSTAAIQKTTNSHHVITNRPQIFWSHARVLQTIGQGRDAKQVLQTAAAIVENEAKTLPTEWREGFVTAVTLHRHILQQAALP